MGSAAHKEASDKRRDERNEEQLDEVEPSALRVEALLESPDLEGVSERSSVSAQRPVYPALELNHVVQPERFGPLFVEAKLVLGGTRGRFGGSIAGSFACHFLFMLRSEAPVGREHAENDADNNEEQQQNGRDDQPSVVHATAGKGTNNADRDPSGRWQRP